MYETSICTCTCMYTMMFKGIVTTLEIMQDIHSHVDVQCTGTHTCICIHSHAQCPFTCMQVHVYIYSTCTCIVCAVYMYILQSP